MQILKKSLPFFVFWTIRWVIIDESSFMILNFRTAGSNCQIYQSNHHFFWPWPKERVQSTSVPTMSSKKMVMMMKTTMKRSKRMKKWLKLKPRWVILSAYPSQEIRKIWIFKNDLCKIKYVFEINVVKRWIRHRTTLNLNDVIFNREPFYVGSASFRNWFQK